MPQPEIKALWQPFLPNLAASLLIPPQSEVPLPPNEWLTKNEKEKSPENIPFNEVLKNIPQDRVNFFRQPSKQTNKQENKKKQLANRKNRNKNTK